MKSKRSTKWTFLFYQESAPENYKEVLDGLRVPYVLSPWHDKDVNSSTGELKKPHKHGAFFFETLKSYDQVSELISENLNGPSHVEIVLSATGLFSYFTHADNPEKTQYNIEDIESGSGFNLELFLMEQDKSKFIKSVIDIIEENDIKEFQDLVYYAADNDLNLLQLIIDRTFFFSKYLDSRRYNPKKEKSQSNNK